MPIILYHLFLNLSTFATATHNVTNSTAIVIQNPVATPSQNVIYYPFLQFRTKRLHYKQDAINEAIRFLHQYSYYL